MLDNILRISFLTLVGLSLLILVVWYLQMVTQELRGTGQVVIDPLTVIDIEGKPKDGLGAALSQMLQARLQTLIGELRETQERVMAPAPGDRAAAVPAGPIGDVRSGQQAGDVQLGIQSLSVQIGLLQPVEMKLSVAGVEVGGLLPMVQRWFSSRRTIHFTVYLQEAQTQVYGSLEALGLSNTGMRLTVKADEGQKTVALESVVDHIAHEILHQLLAKDRKNRLEVLETEEFMALTRVLVGVGKAQRNGRLGRVTQPDYARLLPDIVGLADRVQQWPELGLLAARIADGAHEFEKAQAYYLRVQPAFEVQGNAKVSADIATRLAEIQKLAEPPAGSAEGTATLPDSFDLADKVRTVRDSGAEGSVVGQALATALELQIASATGKEQPISARHIYYLARGADVKSDSGAQVADGVKALEREGAVAEDVWPYVPGHFADRPPPAVKQAPRYRATAARKVATTLDSLKRSVVRSGPVVLSFATYESAMSEDASKTGVLPVPAKDEREVGGHAVVLVGYDDARKQLKFVNSWGRGWGDKGFGYLPYDYVKRRGSLFEAWVFKYGAD